MFAKMWFFLFLTFSLQASELFHHDLHSDALWEKKNVAPFDELIVSWDAKRPTQGYYLIRISVLLDDWSSWFDYAVWKSDDQYTFDVKIPGLSCYQDTMEVLEDKKATGFKIEVIPCDGAHLKEFRTLHASTADLKTHTVSPPSLSFSGCLSVPGLSQMCLPEKLSKRLCSPTSTMAVVRALHSSTASVLSFAEHVHDSTFDIYGNWPLNTAEASNLLGPPWHVCVARLSSFDDIIASLQKGWPVVVSVRGPLPGSASLYESGHLIVVRGFDSHSQKVFCMDPAFSQPEDTYVSYDLNDFLSAWSRRKGTAYLFYR